MFVAWGIGDVFCIFGASSSYRTCVDGGCSGFNLSPAVTMSVSPNTPYAQVLGFLPFSSSLPLVQNRSIVNDVWWRARTTLLDGSFGFFQYALTTKALTKARIFFKTFFLSLFLSFFLFVSGAQSAHG